MKRLWISLTAAFLTISCLTSAEDIEIYVGNSTVFQGAKPQVLIIFDNSGSMASSMSIKNPYDPSVTYPAVGSSNSYSSRMTYFMKGTGIDNTVPIPDSPSESRRFNEVLNGCHEAQKKLDTIGFYTGYIMEYSVKFKKWQEIKDNSGAETISVIDCLDDVLNNDATNDAYLKDGSDLIKLPDGFPIDGVKDTPYGNDVTKVPTSFGAGEVVTLYTDNYLRWYHASKDDVGTQSTSRLQVAKETIKNLLASAPAIDFGLEIFNINSPYEYRADGGRIIAKIGSSNTSMIDTVSDIDAETNTPLCESLWEAFQYYGGKPVDFGDNDAKPSSKSKYVPNTPPYDTSAISGGSYISPFKGGCGNSGAILVITDGEPTLDAAANSKVKALPNNIGLVEGSYMPALAHWMQNFDVNTNVAGKQTIKTYTIGFGDAAISKAGRMLNATATYGGGKYYPAEDAAALATAIQATLVEILQINSTFTAPSVASNNFDRTRSLDAIYYAMFLPGNGARWFGNLKKLRVSGSSQVDAENAYAIDSQGNIKDDARTIWTSKTIGADGNDVKKGGVASMLAAKADRTVYTDVGTPASGKSLPYLKYTNLTTTERDTVAAHMSVDQDKVEGYLKWAYGFDVDDEDNDSSTSIREDVFGDPLHSKPLAINYGGDNGTSDVRIVIGTNAGMLHMFQDKGDTVDENWAFIPWELYPNIPTLRRNSQGYSKPYGIDGSPVMYFLDKNSDGKVDASAGDKVWVFVGMRRGGQSYYAFDLTIPDNPKLMWQIRPETAGFTELGQTWSKPKVVFIKGYADANGPKPLLAFGAGYDVGKDVSSAESTVGRGLYVVEAQSGSVIWSLTPAATSRKNTQFAGKHAVASDVTTLDADHDGYIDRLYASDTAGNVWRVDIPSSSPSTWIHYKLAELGGIANEGRRFFSEPISARTFYSSVSEVEVKVGGTTIEKRITREDIPFDAVLVGSGNRANPLGSSIQDKLFMIKDENVAILTKVPDNWSPIKVSDLYDITSNPFNNDISIDDFVAEEIDMTKHRGWFYQLASSEKALSSATVIGGVAYFTTFTPSSENSVQDCKLKGGAGTLYAFNLHYGTAVYDTLTFNVGNRIPDTPELFLGDKELLLIGVGGGESNNEGEASGLIKLVGIPEGNECDETSGLCKPCTSSSDCEPPPCKEGEVCDPPPGKLGLKTFRNFIFVNEGAQ